MSHRDKDGCLIYCEHNRKGLLMYSLYGRFRVYTCALDIRRGRHWLAGWNEECEYICSGAPKGTKYIHWDEMQKNEECLRDEEQERQEKLKKAKSLRNKALAELGEADALEKEARATQ